MIADDSAWRNSEILCELFRQWRGARAYAPANSFQQPFRRNWETLLEDAHLISGEARREADRDARALAALGLIELKTVRYRPYQIERIAVPLEAESRLRTLFADRLPDDKSQRVDLTTIEWEPELTFLKTTRTGIAADDLLKLNVFFANQETICCKVPVKERSLQIFGDEKRLDALRTTILFTEGRLTLDQLHCFAVAEPLSWKRGSRNTGAILVIENASTWDSYGRWNAQHGIYSAVVYGGGNRFVDTAIRLPDVFSDVGGQSRVLYFGDLDPIGVRIPQAASRRIVQSGLPPIAPELWSYTKLLELGSATSGTISDTELIGADELQWLGQLADPIRQIFDRGLRIAQEHLGWAQLLQMTPEGIDVG
jgi:hypothetical protein